MQVREYFLFDPFEGRLEGYVLDTSRWEYRPIEPDARGRLRSTLLGLWLGKAEGTVSGVEAAWLRRIDDEGRVRRTGAERAEVEREWAEVAEPRLRQAGQRLLASGMTREQVADLLGIDASAMEG